MPRINLAFGSLNPITKPKIGVNYKDNSPVSTLKNSAEKYYDSNAFENQGTLLAICLKIEPQLFPPPTSWPFNTLGEEYANNKVWFSVRARIPEIHSCIPDPLSYGDNVTDTALQHINMHPLFLSQTPIEKLGSELPVPGDIIRYPIAQGHDGQDRIKSTICYTQAPIGHKQIVNVVHLPIAGGH